MVQFEILQGSALEDFRQKKLEEMFNFLDSKKNFGDSIVTFANGISEMMLEIVMNNSIKQLADSVVESVETTANDKTNSILLYICTLQPVAESEKTFWLGGEEIRRDVVRHYQTLAADCGIDMQVVMDSDSEMLSEEKLGWEELIEPVESSTRKVHHCNSERTEAKVISELAGDEI